MHKQQQAHVSIPYFVSIVDHHWHRCYETIIPVSYSMQQALAWVNAPRLWTITSWAQTRMLFPDKDHSNLLVTSLQLKAHMKSFLIIDFNHCFGLSRLRSNVFRAFMTPAPVPSAVIDHTLIYGLRKVDVCSRAKGSSSFPTCHKQTSFSQCLGFTNTLHIFLSVHCCIPQRCTIAAYYSAKSPKS